MEDRKKYSEIITEQLIALLKKGTAPWQIPWKPGQGDYLPNNPISKRRYSGINSVVLQTAQMLKGYEDNRWLTYKQAQALQAEVREGEKATTVQYWKFYDDRQKRDENGHPVLGADNQPIIERFRLERPRIFFSSVFNAQQIDGLPPIDKTTRQWIDLEQAEAMLQATQAVIIHTDHQGAFYRPATDTITIPGKDRFVHAADYYATALHEVGHWTGHETRLNRDIAHPFGSQEYAKEELRAEIASMMLGSDLGIGHDPSNHASYVDSWIQLLKDDPAEIFRAASDAEHIRNYLNQLVNQQALNQQESRHIDSNATHTRIATADHDKAALEATNRQQVERLLSDYTPEEQVTLLMIAESLKGYRNGCRLQVDFVELVRDKLTVSLKPDWNGKFKIQGNAEKQGEDGAMYPYPVEDAELSEHKIVVWSVYTQQYDSTYSWVEDLISQDDVKALSHKLHLIDALSTEDTLEKSVKLARLGEAQSIGNPDRTQVETRKVMNNPVKMAQTGDVSAQRPDTIQSLDPDEKRLYLIVPYVEKEQAKVVGAKWDKVAKSWYVDQNRVDPKTVEQWLPRKALKNVSIHTPQEQFTQFLSSLGAVTSDQPIIMNGKKHRIRVPGDKGQEKSGVYFGYLDGKPAGYFKNFRTNTESRWKADAVHLTDTQKQALIVEAEEKIKFRREAEIQAQQESAKTVKAFLACTQPASDVGHPYLTFKNVRGGDLRVVGQNPEWEDHALIRVAQDKGDAKQLREQHPDSIIFTQEDLLIPLQDLAGTLWGVQIIQADGTKFYSKHTRKEHNFHVVGSRGLKWDKAIDTMPAIIIVEGYATADTLSQALNQPVIAAFDSGNLPKVAQDLQDRYLTKPIIIAGDDDLHLESLLNRNPGKEKALEAAQLVEGRAVFPVFAPGEQQTSKLSDFNDLANKSILGMEAVRRQVESVLNIVTRDLRSENDQTLSKTQSQQREVVQKRALVR